ncbi:MAG TPA: TonB-dependent receptor [Azospirillaceae bacterium]|nr:TonB-dependent receptor [Azospirillaceae bacterium]
MRERLFLTTALAATSLMPAAADAQSGRPQEEVVVTATRVPTDLSRIATGVSVVTRDDIDRNGWQTLPEALRTLPGMSVVSSGGPGGNTSVFLRGTNSDHVLVLLDGLPVNEPALSAGAFNFGEDLLGDLQRIEVVRGPASTLYGSAAIGGVINLITRAGADRPLVAEAAAAAGTDGLLQGRAGLRGTLDQADYALSVEGLTTGGDNYTPRRFTSRNLGEADGFENLTATAKGVLRVSETAKVEALLRWRDADLQIDSVPTDDPNYTGRSETLTLQAAGELKLLDERLTSRLSAGRIETKRGFRNAADVFSVSTNNDRFDGERLQFDWQNTLAASRDLTLTAGATATHEDAVFTTRSTSAFGPFNQDVDARADAFGAYAQAQLRLAERVDVTAGIRHDLPDDYGTRTTWKLGAVVAVPEIHGRLKAAGGTAYKAPTLYDRYGLTNFGYRGNPDLQAEESEGWEAGAEFDVPGGVATLGASYFANDVDRLIQFDFIRNSSFNLAKADIEGVESFVALTPLPWLEARLNYTWTDARDGTTGTRLLRRPEHQVGATARVEPLPGLTISPEAMFVGRRLDVIYGDAGNFIGTRAVGGYWQMNLAVSYAVTDGLTVFARGTNLADRRIENPNGFAQPDRGGLVGLRASF